MAAAFNAILPFFAIVVIGWWAARRGIFNEAGLAGLNAFIFSVALPPLLFRVMSRAPEAGAETFGFIAAVGAATIGLYLLARLLARVVFGLRGAAGALFGHLAVNGNVGFLGLPIIAAALGPDAALPAAMVLVFDIVVIMSLTTLSLEAARAGGSALRAIGRTLASPVLIGALGGLVWGLVFEAQFGIALAEPVARLLDTLGQAAAPAALFATGATLAHKKADRRVAEIGALAVLKLALHPALAVAAFIMIPTGASPLWIAAAVLACACPASNNAVVFANVYGAYEARASATVLVTTAVSLASFAGLAAWLVARGV